MIKTQDKQISNKLMHILLSLLYVASCVFIPLMIGLNLGAWTESAIALTIAILSLIAFSKVANGFRYVFTYALFLSFTVFLGGFTTAGVLASIIGATCLFPYLCLKAPIYITAALPAVAYIPALAATRNPLLSALVFVTLPASLLCVYVIKAKRPRVSAICHISTGFCISFAAIVAIAVFKFSGSLSFESFFSFAEQVREMLRSYMPTLLEMAGITTETVGTAIDLEWFVDTYVTLAFNLLPATVILYANAASYLIHSLTLTLVYNDEKDKQEVLPMLSFGMSIHSAFIFIIALILALTLNSANLALYGTAASNVAIILIPGFVITALEALRNFVLKRQPSCFGTLLYFGTIFFIAGLSIIGFTAAALAGSIVRIVVFFKERAKNKKS